MAKGFANRASGPNTESRSDEAGRVFQRWLRCLRGQLCWGAEWSLMTNLSMSFGRPAITIVREPYETESCMEEIRRHAMRRIIAVRGRWWLWVYLAYWSVSRGGKVQARTSSPVSRKQAALMDLNGQKLEDIEILGAKGITRFLFDLGSCLDVRAARGSADEIWLLYGPGDLVLSLRSDGVLISEKTGNVGEPGGTRQWGK